MRERCECLGDFRSRGEGWMGMDRDRSVFFVVGFGEGRRAGKLAGRRVRVLGNSSSSRVLGCFESLKSVEPLERFELPDRAFGVARVSLSFWKCRKRVLLSERTIIPPTDLCFEYLNTVEMGK